MFYQTYVDLLNKNSYNKEIKMFHLMNSEFVQKSLPFIAAFAGGFILAFYIMGGKPEVNVAEYDAKIEILNQKIEVQKSQIAELDKDVILYQDKIQARQKSIDSLKSKIKYGFRYYEKELKRLRSLSDDELLEWLRARYNK